MTSNWNLLGHNWAVDLLKGHIAHDAVRHAYLITGAPGLGRRSLALKFAQALNCEALSSAQEPCGTCRNCKQINAMQHPDLTITQTLPDKRDLSIDQVRESQRSLSLRPYQAKYRTALFLRFQEASVQAQNALLKTLEEAPPHVILILTADNAEQLLPTIISRCEILRLRPLSVSAVESHLRAHNADAITASLIAHLSGGRVGYAMHLLADPAVLEFRREKLDELQTLLSANHRFKFSYIDKNSKDKEAFRKTLFIWLSYWRDVMLLTAQEDAPIENIDRVESLRALAEKISLPQARKTVKQIEQTLDKLDKNVNSKLLGEVLLMDWI